MSRHNLQPVCVLPWVLAYHLIDNITDNQTHIRFETNRCVNMEGIDNLLFQIINRKTVRVYIGRVMTLLHENNNNSNNRNFSLPESLVRLKQATAPLSWPILMAGRRGHLHEWND